MASRKKEPRPADLEFRRALGAVIRDLRKPNFNQDDFAAEVGVYRSHMGLIEQGKLDIRLTTLRDIAQALGLEASVLLAQAEQRKRNTQPPNEGCDELPCPLEVTPTRLG